VAQHCAVQLSPTLMSW